MTTPQAPPRTTELAIFAAFCAAAFVVRAPILNLGVVDWDESTFLIMGRDAAAGRLPYLHLWDNKPPLMFWLAAPISALADGDIAIVRIAATVLDIFTALLAKELADRMFGRALSHWLVAVLCFAIVTRGPAGGLLLTYSFINPLALGALVLLADGRQSYKSALLAGLLLGAAALCRLNIAIAAALVTLFLFAHALWRRDRAGAARALTIAAGGLAALVMAFAPYAITGHGERFIQSVFGAPLAYVGASRNPAPWVAIPQLLWLQPYLLAFVGLVGLSIIARRRAIRSAAFSPVLAIFTLGALICISFGPIYPHYLTVLIPPLCVWAAPALHAALASARTVTIRAIIAGLFCLALGVVAGKWMMRLPALTLHDPQTAFETIQQNRQPGDTFYFAAEHINYWRLHAPPPHAIVTHPDNLFLEFFYPAVDPTLTDSGDAMVRILAQQPVWIVLPRDDARYWNATKVARVLQPALAAEYEVRGQTAFAVIYRRKPAR